MKKIDWLKQPLGIESDAVIAKRLGVAADTVGAARRRLGVEPTARGLVRRPKYIDWTSVDLCADTAKIASSLGVGLSAVWAARRRFGVRAGPGRGSNSTPKHKMAARLALLKLNVKQKGIEAVRNHGHPWFPEPEEE